MNHDHVRTDPPGAGHARPVAWFCWHDDVPRAPGSAHDPDEPRTCDGTGPVDPDHGNGASASLPPERLNALRRWIALGGHNAPEVAEQVARRILEAGEL